MSFRFRLGTIVISLVPDPLELRCLLLLQLGGLLCLCEDILPERLGALL